MEQTPCPSVVTVGEPQAHGTIKVHCALTGPHLLHAATLFGRERTWITNEARTWIRQW